MDNKSLNYEVIQSVLGDDDNLQRGEGEGQEKEGEGQDEGPDKGGKHETVLFM